MTRPTQPLVTALARTEHGDNQLRGFSVGDELAGKIDTWSLLSVAVGHRRLDGAESLALDAATVCNSAADPRVWPLKIVRLVAAYGSQVPAILAGVMSGDRGFVGWSSISNAMHMLADTRTDLANEPGLSVASWVEKRLAAGKRAPGFGIPFRSEDERVVALRRVVEQQGRLHLAHWQLAENLHTVLAPKGLPLNIAGASGAVLLDIGFNPSQADALALRLLFENYAGNAVEGAAQAPEILRHLPDEFIEDATRAARESPRAAARRRGLEE